MRELTAHEKMVRQAHIKKYFKTHGARLVGELRSSLGIYILSNKKELVRQISFNFNSRIAPVIEKIKRNPEYGAFLKNSGLVWLSDFNPLDPMQSTFESQDGYVETLANIIEETIEQGDFTLSESYDKWFMYYGPLLARALGREKIKVNPFLVEAYNEKALNFFAHSGMALFKSFAHLLKLIKLPALLVEVALVALFAPKKKVTKALNSNIKTASSSRVAQRYVLANQGLDDDEKREVYRKWHGLINMTQKELDEWGDNPARLKASLNRQRAKESGGIQSGYDSFRRIVRRKSKPFKDWSSQDFKNAQQEINFNTRMLGNNPGRPVNKDVMKSKWEISLLNWGHDPSKKSSPAHGKWKAWSDDLK